MGALASLKPVASTMKAVRVWTYLCVVLVLAACRIGPGEDISSEKPYADLIGVRYSVVADNLIAHGVYESLDNRVLSYIELVPIRLGGAEYAFRRKVQKGQVVRILSARRQFIPLQNGVYYLVAVENSDLPQGLPIRLALFRGNEGEGADLNPAMYRRLPKGN